MGIKLSEIKEGTKVVLQIRNEAGTLKMGALVKKHVKENVAFIELDYEKNKKLVFDNVQIRMEYTPEGDVPIIWNNVKVVYYKASDYVAQALVDGVKNNRRNSFRVGVSQLADLRRGDGPGKVMIRDISLSGFSVTDKKGEIPWKIGDEITVKMDDLGCILNLVGKVVRIEKQPGTTIYGLEICNLCKDLSAYVSLKQRRNRESKPTGEG